jgi:hypothetical protein
MTNLKELNQVGRRRLSRLDRFSIATGLIGLVADTVSLGGLSLNSSGGKETFSLGIWILVLVSVIYSVAISNFFIRRKFHQRLKLSYLQNPVLYLDRRRDKVENGIQATTLWIGVPILMAYFIFVFHDNSSFDSWASISFPLLDLFSVNLISSLGIATGLCIVINYSILFLYQAYFIFDED